MKYYGELPVVAYFCMEFGLHPSLKTYAGGLGVLAGDYLKGVKDYGYPIVGIGIKWKQGYTDQYINGDGWPYDLYKDYKYDFLKDTGVNVKVKIRNKDVLCKIWKVDCFGNAPLFLLDTDLPENEDRWITEKLYHGSGDDRIAQEIVLGVGGVRALRALGIDVDLYHFNEGHAVFAGLELIREKMSRGASFEEVLAESRKQIVFTTHTPVIEGNESHPIDRLMYMGANNGITREEMIKIGGEPFNMTVAALRLSHISNAVSQLHCKISNEMWKHVDNRSKIIGITNAIHLPTWVDSEIIKAAEEDRDIWSIHMKNKIELIEFIRDKAGVKLEEESLLIGFSRRAATYKRGDLIFRDENIIGPLLEKGKLQIVLSGKAHPQDNGGKKIIADIVKISKKYPDRIVYLENYDITIAKKLVRGCDVWLNNPRRPKEASGTSGMKAAMNGVLNLSILDGWWPEACKHHVNGWQFGDGFQGANEQETDKHDLEALYQVLLEKVIPTYYNNRNKWIKMMRNSILSTKDEFSIERMLKDYYNKMYIV
jgi:starch phosphorylase